jgi:3'(2'), 5'-bisphosphate nucleotidase
MSLTDSELSAHLAQTAGRILWDLRRWGMYSGKALGEIGDQAANRYLVDELRKNRRDDVVLSEEEVDRMDRLGRSRVWIIDPLDGTREYGEDRCDWAVHVALAIDGVPTIGAVALPGLGLLFRSDKPIEVPAPSPTLRMVVSRTRPAAEALAVAQAIGAELVPMGSAGAKAMAVIRGEADIYLHTGGQYEWDSCAPAAVALAHGLHVSRADGSPLVYNQANTYMPDLLVCRHEHAPRVREALAAL